MTINADAVEGLGNGGIEDLGAFVWCQFGIGEDYGEHSGHIGGDHRGALADTGDANGAVRCGDID